MNDTKMTCPICNGQKNNATTTFSVDLGFGVVVVRDVPALVCEQCGSEWIDDKDSEQLEKIVQDARKKHAMVEVTSFTDLLKEAS